MKIPDANILIYAHDLSSPFHVRAKTWLAEAIADPSESVGIAPTAALGFIRLISNPRIYLNPLPLALAIEAVNSWLEAGAVLIEVGKDHFASVGRLMEEAHGGPNLLTDAHLAALAIERRATLYSNDRDFQRFKGLRLKNPIE